MNARLFLPATVAAVVAAVIVGLLIVGGPFEGRREAFDGKRYDELGLLARALLCADKGHRYGATLPEELTVETLRVHCSSAGITEDELTDDETGLPYVYQVKDGQDFSVCATFYDAERTLRLNQQAWYGATFNAETGCASGVFR